MRDAEGERGADHMATVKQQGKEERGKRVRRGQQEKARKAGGVMQLHKALVGKGGGRGQKGGGR